MLALAKQRNATLSNTAGSRRLVQNVSARASVNAGDRLEQSREYLPKGRRRSKDFVLTHAAFPSLPRQLGLEHRAGNRTCVASLTEGFWLAMVCGIR